LEDRTREVPFRENNKKERRRNRKSLWTLKEKRRSFVLKAKKRKLD